MLAQLLMNESSKSGQTGPTRQSSGSRGTAEADSDAKTATDSECLGEFPSLEAVVRDMLEPLLPAELHWLLDCLDLERVLRAMTADGCDRLRLEAGRVYLDRLDRRPHP